MNEKLTELNEKIKEDLEQHLNIYIDRNLTINTIKKLQKETNSILKQGFSALLKKEDIDNIDSIIKINVKENQIFVYPNNLFTGLLMNNKYRNDLDAKTINSNNHYYLQDNTIAKFNEVNNTLYKLQLH